MFPAMTRLFLLFGLALTGCTTSQTGPTVIRASLVSPAQIIDRTHLQRRTNDEIEVDVVQQTRGAGLLTFFLNGQPIAKLDYGEMLRLYLSPGRYRFGVAPSHYFGGTGFWQMNADVTRNTHQIYRIFQSAGFTSSGGNAVYEIARY
jgi:hypothetical protein